MQQQSDSKNSSTWEYVRRALQQQRQPQHYNQVAAACVAAGRGAAACVAAGVSAAACVSAVAAAAVTAAAEAQKIAMEILATAMTAATQNVNTAAAAARTAAAAPPPPTHQQQQQHKQQQQQQQQLTRIE